jgi:hypothetical protein
MNWRWPRILLLLALGLGLGLFYGWIVSPVRYVDIAPDRLRIDYKTDYVQMTAEVFQADGDAAAAAARLALLGPQPPVAYVQEALAYARAQNEAPAALASLEALQAALARLEESP